MRQPSDQQIRQISCMMGLLLRSRKSQERKVNYQREKSKEEYVGASLPALGKGSYDE